MFVSFESEFLQGLAATAPDSTPDELAYLAFVYFDYTNPDSIIQYKTLWGVAGHENTSKSTLARLAEHPSSSVRSSVANNKNTPVAVINSLLSDSDFSVRYFAFRNPSRNL